MFLCATDGCQKKKRYLRSLRGLFLLFHLIIIVIIIIIIIITSAQQQRN